MPKIKFINDKKEVEVPDGTILRDAAIDAGVEIQHHAVPMPKVLEQRLHCRGHGTCGTCHVHIKKGVENCSAQNKREKFRLAIASFTIGHEDEVRLACQTKVHGDIEVVTRPTINLYGDKFWE